MKKVLLFFLALTFYYSYSFADAPPTVTVTAATAGPTNNTNIAFNIEFSENVTGFTNDLVTDLNLSTTTGGTLVAAVAAIDGNSYTVTITGQTGTGTITLGVRAGAAVNGTAEGNTASATAQTIYDGVAPTISSLVKKASQADPTNTSPVLFTITFSEPIDAGSFIPADVSTAGTTAAGATVTNVTSIDASTFEITVSSITGSGNVVVGLNASVITDPAGNNNTASTTATVVFDNNPPDITSITKKASQDDPTNVGPILFTIVFDEAISGFIPADINLTGTSTGGSVTSVTQVNTTTWEVTVSGMTSDGTVIIDLPANRVQDAAGNNNTASATASVTLDTDNPDISTSTPANGAVNVSVSNNITFTFDEAIRNIDNSPINNSNISSVVSLRSGSVSGIVVPSTITISGNTVTIDPNSNLAGSTQFFVVILPVEDNANNATTSPNINFSFTTIDSTPPTVTTYSPADGDTGVATDTDLVITFSEPVIISSELQGASPASELSIRVFLDNNLFQTINRDSPLISIIGNTVTININDLNMLGKPVYVLIGGKVFTDSVGNPFAAVTDPDEWNFTTSAGALVTVPNGGACPGTFSNVGAIVITETAGSNIDGPSNASRTLVLQINGAGFQFKPCSSGCTTVTASFTANRDIDATSVNATSVTFTTATFTIPFENGNAKNEIDVITINGLQITTDDSNPTATIVKSASSTLNIQGIVNGSTVLANLSKGGIPSTPTYNPIGQTIVFCQNSPSFSSAQLTVTGSNVRWYSDAGLTMQVATGNTVTIGSGLNVNGAASGDYTRYATQSTGGCESSPLIVPIRINLNPEADAGDDQTICSDATYTIGGAPTLKVASNGSNYTYNWTYIGPNTGPAINPSSNPIVDFPANNDFPQVNKVYTIRVTLSDNLGCSDTDDIVISVRPQINAFLTKPTTNSFSPTTPAQELEANPPGGIFTGIGVIQSGTNTYRFDPATANASDANTLPKQYGVKYNYVDGFGCTNNTLVNIAVFTLSNSFFTNLLAQYCNDEYPFTAPGVGGLDLTLSNSAENAALTATTAWNTTRKKNQNKLYFAPTWNPTTTYDNKQVVQHNGRFFAAKFLIIGNIGNLPPDIATFAWDQDILDVEFKGVIRNYYEGLFGGNQGPPTIQKQNTTYIVNGTTYPVHKFYTNNQYTDCPNCDYSLPGTYLSFKNPRDVYHFIDDWSSFGFYFKNDIVTYQGSIYKCIKTISFSNNEQPNFFPTSWQNVTNSNFDTGRVYQIGDGVNVTESGFNSNTQFVVVNKKPVVSFSGLKGPINTDDFCQTNTSIELVGSEVDNPFNPNKGSFLISVNGAPETNSVTGFSNTSPGFASFNPLQVATGNLGANNNVTITYVYDPGTDGSTGQACSGISSRNIVINTPPAFAFVNPTPAESTDFCFEGASVTLQTDQTSNVTFSGFGTSIQVPGFQGSFNPASAFNSSSGSPGATRTITVNAQFTDAKGCTNTISRNYDVLAKPTASFTPSFGDPDDIFYCYGDPQITFGGNSLVAGQSSQKFFIKFLGQTTLDPDLEVNGASLNFDPSDYYDIAVTRGQNPLNDAQFRVTYQLIDKNNCSSSIFKTYTVSPSIQVSINNLVDNEVYCSNQIKTITFNPFPAESAKRNLKYNNVTQTITSNSFTIPASTPTSTTNVIIEYEVIGGTDCATTVTKTATVLRSPTADFGIDLTAPRCVDIPVTFNAITSGNGTDAIYKWTLQDVNQSGTNLTSVSRSYNASNQYNTVLRVEYPPQSGVTCFDQKSDLTTIGNNPIVSFNFANVCEGDATNFSATTIQAVATEYKWKFGSVATTNFGNAATNVGLPLVSGTFSQPIVSFAPNNYQVEVIAKTANNCTDTLTRTVSILNKVSVADNTTYAMLNTNGNWVPENLSLGVDSSTWAFANPSGTKIGIADNLSAWVTNATGPYKANDQSVVNSPCFNLTGLSKPVLSIDYWSDTRSGLDGAFLQFSTDGGATWQLLGGRNTGIQWYNAIGISSVGSAPGNPLALGWSFEQPTNQDNWLEAKHSLEAIPAGSRSNVRFRIRFTSNPDFPKSSLVDENRLVDGFAFRNVKIESRNRTILSENFTNENALNFQQNNTNFATYGSASTSDLIKIQFHSSIGGADEVNSRNSSDPDARTAFYGVTQGIRGYIDGFSGGNFITPWATDYFSLRSLVTSPVNINISTPAVVDGKWQFNNTINVVSDLNPQFQYSVFTAIINKDLDGVNKNVLRKMLPNAAGVRLTSLTGGQNQVVPISYDLSGIDPTEYPNLAIVTFVQKINGDKDVLQARFLDSFTISGDIITSVEYPINTFANAYPNPADKSILVKLNEPVKENVDLTLTDSFGIKYHLGTLKKGQDQIETNVERFAPGLYIIHLKSGSQTVLHKVIIER